MSVVAIFGAGELGGALASKLAGRARVREIRLIDRAAGVAAGKALDILQAGPIENSSTRITTAADEASIADAAVIVLADDVMLPASGGAAASAAGGAAQATGATAAGMAAAVAAEIRGEAGLALLRRIRSRNSRAPIVCAGAAQAWLIARATTELAMSRTQIAGSAPYALVSALRAMIALELNGSAQDICVTLAGTPPDGLLVPWHAASTQGATLDRLLDAATLRRLDTKLRYLWPPGPYALAAAAARFVEAFIFGSPRTFCGFVAPVSTSASAGEAATAIALPLRLDPHTGVRALDVPALSTSQRATLDTILLR